MRSFDSYKFLNGLAEKKSVVLFGGSYDKDIPVTEIMQAFDYNFKVYNRSFYDLSVADAKTAFAESVESLNPEGIIIHIGADDLELFRRNPTDFDNHYLELISYIKNKTPKCGIMLVSVDNTMENAMIDDMNRHIKAIAASEKVDFLNLENAKLWNPKSIKECVSFLYGYGLNERLHLKKPLRDIAATLFSYVYTHNLNQVEATQFAV